MRRGSFTRTALLGVGLAVGVASTGAHAQVTLPDAYVIGRGPAMTQASHAVSANQTSAPVERQAASAIDGAFYAEIFPVFNDGAAGNTSYVRLGAGASASTFHVIVVGSPSGNSYGEGDIQVPANASPQYGFSDLLTTTGAGALANGDTAYSVYISNSATDSFYQHVIYNGTNQFFEDVTICPSGSSIEGGRTLTNVHSSILSGFPSTIYLHNLQPMDAAFTVTMRDSRTGNVLGTLPSLTAAANATYAIPESYFESQLGVTPTANQQHVTLEFHATAAYAKLLGSDPDPVDVGAIFGATVTNTKFNAGASLVLNLSNKCAVNR